MHHLAAGGLGRSRSGSRGAARTDLAAGPHAWEGAGCSGDADAAACRTLSISNGLCHFGLQRKWCVSVDVSVPPAGAEGLRMYPAPCRGHPLWCDVLGYRGGVHRRHPPEMWWVTWATRCCSILPVGLLMKAASEAVASASIARHQQLWHENPTFKLSSCWISGVSTFKDRSHQWSHVDPQQLNCRMMLSVAAGNRDAWGGKSTKLQDAVPCRPMLNPLERLTDLPMWQTE